ncbi:MAG: gamma-glutamyl-gamma-aminobutyrate hydrolase family protein [Candidatus Aminicenantes bacterium]|nr:gamma-glutamyl-gamma-aminobutyrate hydrolase family protein [Candidatus Aminicenantes bacterium]
MSLRFSPSSALPVLVLIALAVFGRAAGAQSPERFFDTASVAHDTVRLTVFYPSVKTLKNIFALKAQGFIPYKNLEIIGVYHVKEKTDYRESVRYLQDEKIEGVRFHAVAADLSVETLYGPNAASDEFRKIFDLSDGMIFFGGPDMPPAAYGEKTDFRTVIEDPYRHYLELSMIFHLLGGGQNEGFKGFLENRPDFPILGICLGMQSLNVGAGGTMVQDLWSEIYGKTTVEEAVALDREQWHKNPYAMIPPLDRDLGPYMLHPIKLSAEGRTWKAMGMTAADRPYVASSHHQSLEKIGKGFTVVATSTDDRIIEAIEHEKFRNVLGVQFHPEFRKLWDATPEYKTTPDDRDLFGYRTQLEAHPPSYEFHKRLWIWFFTRMKAPGRTT